jgi:hypothetical protein
MIDEHGGSVLPGRWNAWLVFGMLMSEIAGDSSPHLAAERVYLALAMRFGEGRRAGISAEEIDDDSPMARVLSRVSRMVAGVAGASEGLRDPMVIREQLAL